MARKRDTKQIDSIASTVGLSREQRRRLHAEITGRNLTYQQILEEAKDIKRQERQKRG